MQIHPFLFFPDECVWASAFVWTRAAIDTQAHRHWRYITTFYTDECDEMSGSVYGFYLLLTLLSYSPAAQPVALKKRKKRESSQTRNESGNSYVAFYAPV